MQNFISINAVRALASEEGFSNCGAAELEKTDISFYNDWINKGYNGSMSYLEKFIDKREDPSLLVENSKTVICFLMSYNDDCIDKEYKFKIASYAQRRDYHYVVKTKLNNIITKIQNRFPDFRAKAFVDTAPICEKLWAVKCGLGWIGKNSLFVSSQFGNKVFIGEILCNYVTDYSNPIREHCGKCTKCKESCPNNAILDNKTIDSTRCISYQTIENKELIPENIDLKNYIYGCDICLNACIWNNKAKKTALQDKDVKDIVSNLLYKAENGMNFKEDFFKLKKISSVERIKFEKLLSNISFAQKQSIR